MRLILPKMACIFMAIGCIPAVSFAATSLKNYKEFSEALNRGDTVVAKVNLPLCSPQHGTEPAQSRGGLQIHSYRVTSDGKIAFSDDHFTVSQQGTPIQQFIRYVVSQNNTVDVTVAMFNVPSYTPYRQQLTYTCTLNQGIQLGAHP